MAVHGSAWKCMEVHGSAWQCMAVHGSAWQCMAVQVLGSAWQLHGIAWKCMAVHGSAKDLPAPKLNVESTVVYTCPEQTIVWQVVALTHT